MAQKWVPKIATPAKTIDPKWASEEVLPWTINEVLGGRQPIHRVKYRLPGGQPDQDFLTLTSKLVLEFATQDIP
jgi:hypothetical protein